MKNRTITSLFILIMMIVPSAAFAKSMTILPFQGESVHPQIRNAARDALSIFLTDNSVAIVGNQANEVVTERQQAQAAAQAAQATQYIEGRITRLGQRAIIQVQVFDTSTNQATYSDRMTAATPSDLETVMQRLARSIASGVKVTHNEDIHTVTQREQRALRRRVANHYFGLTLGGSVAPSQDSSFMSGLGFSWLWDNRNMLLGADWTIHGMDSDVSVWNLSIGGYYPLSENDTTLYVGGGLALSGIEREAEYDEDGFLVEDDREHSKAGLSVFGSVGALIGRTSTVSIRPEIGYSVSTYTFNGEPVHGPRLGLTLGF